MENKNYCETCKFYAKYYTIFNGARLQYANCGHCRNENFLNKKISRKIIHDRLPCEKWEREENKPVSEEKLKKTINDMKLRLDEIVLLLRRD